MTNEVPRPPLANQSRRLFGFVVDLRLLTALALISLPVVSLFTEGGTTVAATSTLTLVNVAIIGVYQVGFVATSGQTPGKVVARTRVVDAVDYAVPSITNALARFALPAAVGFLPLIGIFATMLVYAWLTWDPDRQGLHDKLARTIVVESSWKRPEPA